VDVRFQLRAALSLRGWLARRQHLDPWSVDDLEIDVVCYVVGQTLGIEVENRL
jgi:hypothetical protein